jgi:hypothetical protein
MTESAAPLAFSYSRALAPLLWAFVAVLVVELGIAHLLVRAFWNGTAALIVSGISLAALIWTIAFTLSLKRRPVLVDANGVTMRVGSLKTVRIPVARIAALVTSWPRERLKERGVLNLALINYPNVMLELHPVDSPQPARGGNLKAVAHRLDDPAGFTAAMARIMETDA